MPKVGVVNRLRMRIVQNLVEFPPPLIALHPPLIKCPISTRHLEYGTQGSGVGGTKWGGVVWDVIVISLIFCPNSDNDT